MKWQNDPAFPICLDLRTDDGSVLFGWVRKTRTYGCWYTTNFGEPPRSEECKTVEDAQRGLWEEITLRTLWQTLA